MIHRIKRTTDGVTVLALEDERGHSSEWIGRLDFLTVEAERENWRSIAERRGEELREVKAELERRRAELERLRINFVFPAVDEFIKRRRGRLNKQGDEQKGAGR